MPKRSALYSAQRLVGWKEAIGPDQLGEPHPLEAGLTLHIPPMEWHVFRWRPGGHLDIIFFYGQVDNIRPEEGVR